jgi:hypothetical protein
MCKLGSFESRIHFTITCSRLTNKSFGSDWWKDRHFIVEIISTWLKEFTEILNIFSIFLFPIKFNIWWPKGRTYEKLLRKNELNFSYKARRSHKHVSLSLSLFCYNSAGNYLVNSEFGVTYLYHVKSHLLFSLYCVLCFVFSSLQTIKDSLNLASW